MSLMRFPNRSLNLRRSYRTIGANRGQYTALCPVWSGMCEILHRGQVLFLFCMLSPMCAGEFKMHRGTSQRVCPL